jgi:hypothetical protein
MPAIPLLPERRNATGLRLVQPQADAAARTLNADYRSNPGAGQASRWAACQLAITLLLFTTWATCPLGFRTLACLTGLNTFTVFTWLAGLPTLATAW